MANIKPHPSVAEGGMVGFGNTRQDPVGAGARAVTPARGTASGRK